MTNANKRPAIRAASLMVLFALLFGTAAPAFAQRRRAPRRARAIAPAVRLYTVAANTVIRARMNSELSSKTARVGDRFTTTVTEPVYANNGTEVIPVGSRVLGRVTSVKRAGRRSPGTINVNFYQVTLPNDTGRAINGSLTTLQADDVNADNEGGVEGRGNRKRDAVFIGGGAVTGAIIGGIAGGGKGAAIGTLLGGALGTGARVYEREEEAEVKSGTQFGVILNRSISLPASRIQ